MADSAANDADCIRAAYQEQVKALFTGLFVNLQQAPISHMTEKQCIDKFSTGIKIAKRALDLALEASAVPEAAAVPTTRAFRRSRPAKSG